MMRFTTAHSARQNAGNGLFAEVFDTTQNVSHADWSGANTRSQSLTGALIVSQSEVGLDAASKALFSYYEEQVTTELRTAERDIDALHRLYVVQRPNVVSEFLKSYRYILSLLLEAEPHLTRCFGGKMLASLKVQEDEQGADMIRLAVSWPGEMADAAENLSAFDSAFWLENCKRSAGRLIIDYDLV